MKKILVIVLTICLCIGLVPASIFADNTLNYVSIGDSMVVGYGLEGYPSGNQTLLTHTVESYGYLQSDCTGAFPYKFANWLKWNTGKHVNYEQLGIAGLRTTDFRYILDLDYPGDPYTTNYLLYDKAMIPGYNMAKGTTGVTNWREEMHKDFVTAIKNADVITFGLGGNDIGNYAFSASVGNVWGIEFDDLDVLCDKLGIDIPVEDMIDLLLDTLKSIPGFDADEFLTADMGTGTGEDFIKALLYGYISFYANYTESLKFIYDLKKPDCKVVVLEACNVFSNVSIMMGEDGIDWTEVLDAMIVPLNTYMKGLAPYSDDYIYVDYDFPTLYIDEAANGIFKDGIKDTIKAACYAQYDTLEDAENLGLPNSVSFDSLLAKISDVCQNKTIDYGAIMSVEDTTALAAAYAQGTDTSETAKACFDYFIKITMGCGVLLHPSEVGNQEICDAIVSAYQDGTSAREKYYPYLEPVLSLIEQTTAKIDSDKEFRDTLTSFINNPPKDIYEAMKRINVPFNNAFAKIAITEPELAKTLKKGRNDVEATIIMADYMAKSGVLDQFVEEIKTYVEALEFFQDVQSFYSIVNNVITEVDGEISDAATQISEKYSKFVDLVKGAWYESYVSQILDRGIMNGTSARTFEPSSTATVAEISQMLWNMAGNPAPASLTSFADVKEGDWYAPAIAWAKETGILEGESTDTIQPKKAVLREEIVTMMQRYAEGIEAVASQAENTSLDSFVDAAKVSDYAKSAFEWAVENKIISGRDGKQLAPQATVLRSELATIFANYINAFDK